jgi:hypothetical protein
VILSRCARLRSQEHMPVVAQGIDIHLVIRDCLQKFRIRHALRASLVSFANSDGRTQ